MEHTIQEVYPAVFVRLISQLNTVPAEEVTLRYARRENSDVAPTA